MKELNGHPRVDSLVTQTKHHDQVACAELYSVRFITEHNLPFAIADHFNRLCSVMFPDSKISLVTQTKHHDQVTCAELYFVRFITEHNLPFAIADHFNRLCSVMFPDSKIAAEFECARTKSAAFITHALAPAINEPVIKSSLSLSSVMVAMTTSKRSTLGLW